MKRGGPLKRSKGLDRKGAPKPDPEKVREFLQRGRGQLDRAGQGLRKTRRKRPPEGPLDPATWAKTVRATSANRSILPPHTRVTSRDFPHHVIPKQELRRRGLFDRVWDPRNGVAVTLGEHDEHERAHRRIPRRCLPESVFEFARECGPWALDYIDKTYPTD